jgi:hypothetical protein
MEFVFLVAVVLAGLEVILRLVWADFYFRYGIPVYDGTTRVARQTAIELDLEGAGPALRRESFREVRFRWSFLDVNWNLDFGIHGRILELRDGRHRIIAFMDVWLPLSMVVTAACWVFNGIYLGAAVLLAIAAGVIPVQRSLAGRIRRLIEEAG